MFCEVQGLANWNSLGLAFEVLGPRARRLAKVLSRLFLGARARGPGAIKPHNEKNLRIIVSEHKSQATKNKITNHDYIQLLYITSYSDALFLGSNV